MNLIEKVMVHTSSHVKLALAAAALTDASETSSRTP
jgi:hypothetical protein